MAREFHKVSPFASLSFSEPMCANLFQRYLGGDKTQLIIILATYEQKPIGMIIGGCDKTAFSESTVALEVAWWVDEPHRRSVAGLKLLSAYEDWCIRVGAKIRQLGDLPSVTDLSKLYERKGYALGERNFIQVL